MKRSRLDTLTRASPSECPKLRHEFYSEVTDVVRNARARAYRAVNFRMVEAYWNIGRLIVEEEQRGQERAEYSEEIRYTLCSEFPWSQWKERALLARNDGA